MSWLLVLNDTQQCPAETVPNVSEPLAIATTNDTVTTTTVNSVVVAFTGSSFLVACCVLVFAFSATWTYVRKLRLRLEQVEQRDRLRDERVEELCSKLQNLVKHGALTVDRAKVEQMEGQKKLTVNLGELSGIQVGLGANIVPDANTIVRYGFKALKWAFGKKG